MVALNRNHHYSVPAVTLLPTLTEVSILSLNKLIPLWTIHHGSIFSLQRSIVLTDFLLCSIREIGRRLKQVNPSSMLVTTRTVYVAFDSSHQFFSDHWSEHAEQQEIHQALSWASNCLQKKHIYHATSRDWDYIASYVLQQQSEAKTKSPY